MPNVKPNAGVFQHQSPQPGRKKGKLQPSTTLARECPVEAGNPAALGYLGMHCAPEDWSMVEAGEKGADLLVEVDDKLQVLEIDPHLYASTTREY
ncbi:hypothetical protein KC353_g1886 [Hortaea werneckii]|nr:hypothetical protein KC353_g1886 [Hortaea werneckii]